MHDASLLRRDFEESDEVQFDFKTPFVTLAVAEDALGGVPRLLVGGADLERRRLLRAELVLRDRELRRAALLAFRQFPDGPPRRRRKS